MFFKNCSYYLPNSFIFLFNFKKQSLFKVNVMEKIIIDNIISFAKNLSKTNKLNGYIYLLGVYEENKNHIDDKDLLKLLIHILNLQKEIYPNRDSSFYVRKAIEYSIKTGSDEDLIEIYQNYCLQLYRMAKIDKCALLLENFLQNFKEKLSQKDTVFLRELEISVNAIYKPKEVVRTISFRDIIDEKIDKNLIIPSIISFGKTFFSSYNNDNIPNLFMIFAKAMSYIKANKSLISSSPSLLASLHNFFGNIYYNFGLYTRAKRHFLRAFLGSLAETDINTIAKYQKNVAIALYEIGSVDKANKYFGFIEKLYKNLEDPIVLNQFYSVLGLSYIRLGRISLGNSILKSAIVYRISIQDHYSLLHTLVYSILFNIQWDKDNAKYYYEKFERIVLRFPDTPYYLYTYLFKKILYNEKFETKSFFSNLCKMPFLSFQLVPLFAYYVKYKLPYYNDDNLKLFFSNFAEIFREEMGSTNFKEYLSEFKEYSILFNMDIKKESKIKKIRVFFKTEKYYELNWKCIPPLKNSYLSAKDMMNLFIIKFSNDNQLCEYKKKKYKISHIYKDVIPDDFYDRWFKDILFSRVFLEATRFKEI